MAKVGFGLIRVSTSEQNMDTQKSSLRKIAKNFGYEIADRDFYGEKISGYDEDDSKDRKSIQELREQIDLRKPDAVFCVELSRLSRRAIKVSRYIDEFSVKARIPWYFADYRLWTIDVNTNKPIDDNINVLYGAAQGVEMERRRIRERTMRGRDSKAEQGYFVGHLKDGYTWEYRDGEKVIIIDEDRKDDIKTIFRLYGEQNYSSREVMEYLNANGIPTTNRYRMEHPERFKGYKTTYVDKNHNTYRRADSMWTDGLVCSILRDTWYIGERQYHGITYHIEPIIDRDLWNKVQEHLASAKSLVATDTHKPYLLTSILYCGKCKRKMYAKGDGYNNMYYCSSQEYGNAARCGLRWIRQENLDSIVMNVVKSRTFDDTKYGDKTVLSDFFSVSKSTISQLESKINTCKSAIQRRRNEIDESVKDINFYTGEQARLKDNPLLLQANYKALIDIQTKIDGKEKEIESLNVKLHSLQNEKKSLTSTRKKLAKITNLDDFDEAKAFVHSVIKRIEIFNPDKKSVIIRIYYVHGKEDVVIYSPTRLKKNYYFFTQSEFERITGFVYDGSDCFICKNHFIGIKANSDILVPKTMEPQYSSEEQLNSGAVRYGDWDTSENKERYEQEVKKLLNDGTITQERARLLLASYNNVKRFNSTDEMIRFYTEQGYVFYDEKIPVADYVENKRKSDLLIPFQDILPLSEKGEKRKKHVREWYRNKYNTGKPSFTPFIEKDATYEEIQVKRKRLYNRKNKILNNKHLSDEQKAEQLFRIKEQLDAFKYQIKYLPTNKKGVMNIEKYNKASNQSNG